MHRGGLQVGSTSPWITALLVVALLIRDLIPVGYMPAPGGLTLCSGLVGAVSPRQLERHMADLRRIQGHPAHPSTRDQSHDTPCLFSGAGNCSALDYARPTVASLIDSRFVRIVPAEQPTPPTRFALSVLPRGPPSPP